MHERQPYPEDVVEALNGSLGGFNELIGLQFVSATREEVVAQLTVGPQLFQPYGLVHGGVYSTMIETLASAAAALDVAEQGLSVVGLENSTSFVRAVREGKLVGTATPITRGRRTQVWEVTVRGDDGRVNATGRVRVLCLEKGAAIAGKEVRVI